jgi:GAF domain-containing protein
VSERRREEAERDRRTVQLHTAAEVSRAAASILNVDELLSATVHLIRDGFNLYYVGLFLVDESRQNAVLRAGTGEAGRLMLARGHHLAIGGASMIGWCVANQKARIALDVGDEAVRFENPVLPETRSELALPLVSRGQTLGAMTVQSAQASAFSQADIAVLQTMADQIAITISNAQLFEQTQQRAAREAELNRIAESLRRAGDIDAILRVAAEELGQSLRASHASVRLGTPAALTGRLGGQ